MKFGIGAFIIDGGIPAVTLGKAAEERGFDSLLLGEHSHIPVLRETPFPFGPGDLTPDYFRILDPFVTLAAIASVTENLVLGTSVALLIQRDVIHTAKQVATLDLISNGRVLLGVGIGWNREEMRNHGTDPATRGALLNEQLPALKAIWTQEQAEFHGRFVDFDPIFAWPKPVQKPHTPIYVGGNSQAALSRVAAYGDGWLPTPLLTLEDLRKGRERLAEHGRTDVPVTILCPFRDREVVEQWIEADVERVVFPMPSLPEAETLSWLDETVKLIDQFEA